MADIESGSDQGAEEAPVPAPVSEVEATPDAEPELLAASDALPEPASEAPVDAYPAQVPIVESTAPLPADPPAQTAVGPEAPEVETAVEDAAAEVTAAEEVTIEDGAATEAATAEPAEEGARPEGAVAESLDEIAPGTLAAGEPAAVTEEGTEVAVATTVASWPFLVYVGLWIALAAYAVWQFLQIPPGEAVYETQIYSMTIVGGIAMTAAGPLLILVVWFSSWFGNPSARRGSMFISALIKGAMATLAGVAIWWIALIIVDYLRLGRPL